MGWGEAESSLGVHFRISHRSVECWGRQLLGKTSFSFLMFPLIAVLIYIIIVFVFYAGVYSCFRIQEMEFKIRVKIFTAFYVQLFVGASRGTCL